MHTLRRIFKEQEQHGTGGTQEGFQMLTLESRGVWFLRAEACGFSEQRRVVSQSRGVWFLRAVFELSCCPHREIG
jgi:hypothetical protein